MEQIFNENKPRKAKDFVHLHLHTDYSLLQSAIQIKPLTARLKELEMNACAITDYGNLYGAITFYNTLKSNGLHPILGYEAILTFESRFDRNAALKSGERPFYHLVLLAKDLKGYQNLVYLASKAFTEGFYHKPRIDLELLAERSEGLIGLTSCRTGAIHHYLSNGDDQKALEKAKQFEDIFGKDNFYIEIQDHGLNEEEKINRRLVEFTKKNDFSLVAANEAHYLTEDDSRAHELLLCIGEGKTINDSTRTNFGCSKFYVRSTEEMWEIFGDELPDSLNNTLKISEMCQTVLPKGDDLTLPEFPIPVDSNCRTIDEYFEKVVLEGFEERKQTVWQPLADIERLKYSYADYDRRIQKEILTIRDMGFPGYFLIVWEFIRYAVEKGIPVGPGRGSAAGSLVAYCLGITDVDPLQYDLLFERFLNPERVSMPDIDIDFCVRGRADVINHVTEFYGRESVCQIITFGTVASFVYIATFLLSDDGNFKPLEFCKPTNHRRVVGIPPIAVNLYKISKNSLEQIQSIWSIRISRLLHSLKRRVSRHILILPQITKLQKITKPIQLRSLWFSIHFPKFSNPGSLEAANKFSHTDRSPI